MARWVGEHDEPLIDSDVAARVKLNGAELQGLGAGLFGILDVQVQVYLLRIAVRPDWWDVPGSSLDAHDPAAVVVDDVVPITIRKHAPAEHSRPERALSVKVCSIEHDDLPDQFHS
ncbi:MAG TPA: hypothetical protein VM143_15305 [Acidimicrobiales bacterium]|nr:hypothetical protein [Acidimicrobiales bacterium]